MRLFSGMRWVSSPVRGMTEIARDTGLSRESPYRALSDTGNPSLDTTMRVLKALNLRLTTTVA